MRLMPLPLDPRDLHPLHLLRQEPHVLFGSQPDDPSAEVAGVVPPGVLGRVDVCAGLDIGVGVPVFLVRLGWVGDEEGVFEMSKVAEEVADCDGAYTEPVGGGAGGGAYCSVVRRALFVVEGAASKSTATTSGTAASTSCWGGDGLC